MDRGIKKDQASYIFINRFMCLGSNFLFSIVSFTLESFIELINYIELKKAGILFFKGTPIFL